MSDFLLELRCEEIPARMQAGARAELEKLFRRELDVAGIKPGAITVWSTPRRLALIARDLPEATQSVSEEAKGPPEGAPDQAVEGFCRKQGITREQLEVRDVKGRATFFAVIEKPGRAVKAVLAEAIPAIIRDFAWPKSMRWGDASIRTDSIRWVRPLSGIVALLGEDLVECEVHGVTSGRVTLGHRFHHSGDLTIGSAADYPEKLRACHVIVDHEERAALIRDGAARVAAEAGLTLVEDEGLVVENAGLTEWPVPLLGRFDPGFLEVPPEVIQLTARVNQKYFVCESPLPLAGGAGGGPVSSTDQATPTPDPSRKREGNTLANAFVCTANIEPADGGAAIVDGNRKVLAARLSDARFFWEQDRRKTLAQHAEGLARITFHEKLGTVADKVERVAKLARWLVEEGIVTDSPLPLAGGAHRESPLPPAGGAGGGPVENDAPASSNDQASPTPDPSRKREGNLADLAEQAARLCKADLVTEMVGEFPELQGLMGGYYARAEGLPDEVADAIRDHYKPVGQGDEVPTAPVTVAVSLADKLDSVMQFFFIDERPTGSKDPFALRRAAISLVHLIIRNNLRLSVLLALAQSLGASVRQAAREIDEWSSSSEAKSILLEELVSVLENSGGGRLALRSHDAVFIDAESVGSLSLRANHVRTFMKKDLSEFGRVNHQAVDFIIDRLKVQQREAGVRHDLIDAVFSLGGEDDLVRLLARVNALQSYVETAEGANLLAAYKRAANILKKEGWADAPGADPGEPPHNGDEDPMENVDDPDMREIYAAKVSEALSYTPEPAEQALIDALDAAEPQAAAGIAAEDFAAAMDALASLRGPIDAFFDEVTVNDENDAKRHARLALLARFRGAVHKVADFAKIEG